jgi:hypothetical protein
MSSLIYNSALYDALTGAIDFDTDTFYALLVDGSYTPDQDTHLKRSDITHEVTGTGYTAGGAAATVGVTKDNATNRISVALGATSWAASTISANGAVYYKHRGGADTADELVAFIDFGGTITSTSGTFSLTASELRVQN